MPRTTTLVKIAVPAAVLALALTGCRDDSADDASASPSGAASSAPSSPAPSASDAGGGSTGAWNPGSDPKNHLPKGAVGSADEALAVTYWNDGGVSVRLKVRPAQSKALKSVGSIHGRPAFALSAEFTYVKGDADLMKEAVKALTLYADPNTPVPVLTDLPDDNAEVSGCALKTGDDFGVTKWKAGDTRTGCEPFLLPAGAQPPQYMGVFGKAVKKGSHVVAWWSLT